MALVLGVLPFEWRSSRLPIAILISPVLSSAGVFFALLVTGKTFNVAPSMELTMVTRIVARNGLLLLEADHKFRRIGMLVQQCCRR